MSPEAQTHIPEKPDGAPNKFEVQQGTEEFAISSSTDENSNRKNMPYTEELERWVKEYQEYLEMYEMEYQSKQKREMLPWYKTPIRTIEDNCLLIIVVLLVIIFYFVKGNKDKD